MMREDCVSNSPPEVDRARSDSRSASSHRRAAEEEEGAAHPLVPLRQLMVTYRTSRAYSSQQDVVCVMQSILQVLREHLDQELRTPLFHSIAERVYARFLGPVILRGVLQ